MYGARLTSTNGLTTTTDSKGRSIVVSGTYTSYVGSPTGGRGGGGNGGGGSLGGIGVGGLAAIIAVVILLILTCVVILLRRYHARKRAERLQDWFAAWRRNHEGQGIEGGPHMAQRRPLSDASFGTPEHPISRSTSLAHSPSYSPTPSDPFAVMNGQISISSSFSDQSRNPHPPRVPVRSAALTMEQGEVFEYVSSPVSPAFASVSPPSPQSPSPARPQATLSNAPTAFRSKALRNTWRNSQLTIKPIPFNSKGSVVISRPPSMQSLQSQSDQNHYAERRCSSMTDASECTAESVDLMSFPRPPSRSAGPSRNPTTTRSILDSTNISRASLQSRLQRNLGTPTPARSDFNFAISNFGGSSSRYHQDIIGEGDPFADPTEQMPSPMPSSAAHSLFFPVDGSDSAHAGHRSSGQPSNLTRIARSWAPSSSAEVAEELRVNAGDIVRVISRHSIMPDLSEERRLSVSDIDVQGGWALVKRMDPETGISKRGYVPVNCLMDVQGPSLDL